jgi:hypothetical protein
MSKTPVPPEVRFWAKVDASADCWEWTGARMKNGYGVFNLGKVAGTRLAHRYAYQTLVGPIDSEQLDHLCRNRPCVNPDHLEPVTQQLNLMRGGSGSAINARKTHCKYGHSLDDAYVSTTGKAGGWQRMCRTCSSLRYQRKVGR